MIALLTSTLIATSTVPQPDPLDTYQALFGPLKPPPTLPSQRSTRADNNPMRLEKKYRLRSRKKARRKSVPV
jgi:hypothetical protein